MSDKVRGRFRKTRCSEDNVLEVKTYNDVLCMEETKSEHQIGQPEFRNGVCQPLRIGGKHPRGSGSGGPRRRLQDKDREDRWWHHESDNVDDDQCGESNNSFADMIQGLMCDEGGEKEPMDNPCDDLKEKDCKRKTKAGCKWNKGTCLFTRAKEGEKNFYVKYEWKTLTMDGKDTAEEYCYKEVPTTGGPGSGSGEGPQMGRLATLKDHQAWCKLQTQQGTCMAYGCKYKKGKKGKAGKCSGQKKIKCTNLGPGKKVKTDKTVEEICGDYAGVCTYDANEKKPCFGKGAFAGGKVKKTKKPKKPKKTKKPKNG